MVVGKLLINSITVQNYRCIGNIRLDNLSPITILVGRNNTGKSALLEAFSLASTASAGWHDSVGDDILKPIIDRRGGWKYADMMIKLGKPKAEINARGEGIAGILEITRGIEDMSNSAIVTEGLEDYISSNTERTISLYLERISPRERRNDETLRFEIDRIKDRIAKSVDLTQIKAFIGYNNELDEKTEYAVIMGEEPLFRMPEPTDEMGYMLFRYLEPRRIIRSSSRKSGTVFLLTPSIQYLNELQGRLARSGELLNLIDSLREKISYFTDIREVKGDFLVFLKGFRSPVPLGAMGDGFRAQLAILAAISTVKTGLALMEEPETRLHPGFMGSIANQIAETASDGNIQYIISTHSSDFLEFLLRANADLVRVMRMYLVKDATDIDYEVFDGKEAIEELDELKMDLRGV